MTRAPSKQRYPRFDFNADAYIIHNGKQLGMTVQNVSIYGLKALVSEPLEVGQTYALTISDAFLKDAQIIARAVWDDADNIMGFEVLNNNENWHNFIRYLQDKNS